MWSVTSDGPPGARSAEQCASARKMLRGSRFRNITNLPTSSSSIDNVKEVMVKSLYRQSDSQDRLLCSSLSDFSSSARWEGW